MCNSCDPFSNDVISYEPTKEQESRSYLNVPRTLIQMYRKIKIFDSVSFRLSPSQRLRPQILVMVEAVKKIVPDVRVREKLSTLSDV